MTSYQRVKGGEKNKLSGKRWSKDELRVVFNAYITNRNIKIHENNPELHVLASRLGRTVRSVEAQLHMFKSLDKFGFHGYKNMNKICRELWQEYIKSTLPE